MFDDLFGSSPKEERKRRRAKRHHRKGKAAEKQVRMQLEIEGYQVERMHEGADFRATRHDPWTGEIVEEKKVEVKAGKSQLTERQKKEKRRSDNYEVRRVDPLFF